MKTKRIDLMMIKAQCREALRLKRKNQCEVQLYSEEVELLIKILNELTEKGN